MSRAGHNSKPGGPVNADRLKSFIERIEKLEEERKAIGGDVKDVYSEAKGVGYDVATMRKIVALRAKDSADVAEQDTLLDVYKHALGMATGGTVTVQAAPVSEEDLEERASRIVAEVDRCMELVADGQPPGIYAIQGLIGCSTGKASKLRGMVIDRISRETAKVREMKSATPDGVVTETQETAVAVPPGGAPGTVEVTSSPAPAAANSTDPTRAENAQVAEPTIMPAANVWHEVTAAREAHHARVEAEKQATRERRRREREKLIAYNKAVDEDPLTFPPHLDARSRTQGQGRGT